MSHNNKFFISKKYNIPLNKLHDTHMQYYYTTYPKLCCQYDLKPIEHPINPFDYISALTKLNEYYDIKCNYFRELLEIVIKNNNDITKCSIDIADKIIKEYIKFRKNIFCLTIWPHYEHDLKELVSFLGEYGFVYHVKTIKLNYNGAMNLVHQLYSDTNRFPTLDKIKEKVKYLGWEENNNDKNNDKKKVRVIFFENASAEAISGSQSPLKTKIREFLLKNINNKNLRGDDLVHINDFYYQTIEYSQIFLHKKTLSFLKKQNLEKYLSFDKSRLYINTIKQWLVKNVDLIDYERFVIMGSAILYVYGIRQCRDVDGLMLGASDKLNENVAKFFYERQTKFPFAEFGITNTEKYWDKGWDEKDKAWFKLLNINYRDELLFNPDCYFYFNGMKFLTIKAEILKKYIRHKAQDVADMIEIMELLGIDIKLPKVDINDDFIRDFETHLENRYGLGKSDINILVEKYLKKLKLE
jgi:hypothetical protein